MYSRRLHSTDVQHDHDTFFVCVIYRFTRLCRLYLSFVPKYGFPTIVLMVYSLVHTLFFKFRLFVDSPECTFKRSSEHSFDSR
jgi:hypothetical protein